jgi:putative FmdB family regulatory protein
MPTYDYKCSSCQNIQENFHSISSNPIIKCEKCNSTCERMMSSSSNFILKGNNWPSKDMKMKKDMTAKNKKAGEKSKDSYGDGVKKLSDIKKYE